MGSSTHAELVILGSGPAGHSAAVCAARAILRPILITGAAMGARSVAGVATEAWPADVDVVQGPDLKRRVADRDERFSTRIVFDRIRLARLAQRPFVLNGDSGDYSCDALIITVDRPFDIRLFYGQLEMRDGRFVTQTGPSGMTTMTSIQGVFVAGEVPEPDFDQVITSTGTGCMAALDAQRYLGR